ncbi:MAG: molybdate ABC transporter permease subunit [Clostridiales bacterium]|nr:molybdate ABC transporter permease subunit [Clostridiales bacterium]
MPMLDISPLYLSVKTAIVATGIAFFSGIFCAILAMKLNQYGRLILDCILSLPLVLPPTVVGFLLLIIFSLKRPFGSFLWETFGFKAVLSWPGCVIAATVVAFPLMYRNTRAAFEQIDKDYIYAARTLGLSEKKIWYKIVFPMAFPGIISGTVLTFARALGEYGATSMLAGSVRGKTQTMAVAIATEVNGQNYEAAGVWVIILLVIAFVFIFFINLIALRQMKRIQKW